MSKRRRVESRNATRRTSESRISLSNDVCKYSGDNSEPGAVISHKKPMPVTSYTLSNEQITRILCPMMTINRTSLTKRFNWLPNQEKIIECINLPAPALVELKRKSIISPARPWASLGSTISDTDVYNFDFRFQGGKYKYTIMNTCNNVIFLEVREYKLKQNANAPGITASPYLLWKADCENSSTLGDLPFNNGVPVAPDNNNAQGQLKNPTTQYVPSTGNDFLLSDSEIACGFRPNRNSPQLRGSYDIGEKVLVKLCPGQSFVYESVINPFFLSKTVSTWNGTDSINGIQWFSRVIQIFARSQFNTDSTLSDAMCPGPGALHIVREVVENIRSLPPSKPHVQIDQTANTNVATGFGPFYQIASATAVHEDPDGNSAANEVLFQG